jgi:iron uptake system component EfeO
MGKTFRLTSIVAVLALAAAACGGDDGAEVRNLGCDESSSAAGSASGSASASAPGSASGSASAPASCPSGSASASGSGLSKDDLGAQADSALLQTAVTGYTTYVNEQVDDTIAKTKTFTDAVRSGNVDAAKAAFAPSRQGWEAIEPIAGLVEEIDGKVDARVDDFEGVDDPAFTGWHRIEHLLWERNDAAAAAPFATQLDSDLQTLKSELGQIEITPLAMARGAAELVEEVSEGKITGEEDRYSHTDLWDFAANIAGSEKVIELLTPALQAEDPELLKEIQDSFAEVDAGLAKYATPDGGYQSFDALTEQDATALKASLAQLSEELAQVPGALGLK